MNQSDHQQKAGKGVKIILIALFSLCAGIFLVDFLFFLEPFDKHAVFEWENWPGFYAAFGFIACVMLVLISKYILRPLVKRDEDFYE